MSPSARFTSTVPVPRHSSQSVFLPKQMGHMASIGSSLARDDPSALDGMDGRGRSGAGGLRLEPERLDGGDSPELADAGGELGDSFGAEPLVDHDQKPHVLPGPDGRTP